MKLDYCLRLSDLVLVCSCKGLTLTALRQLKLGGMAHALQSQLEQIGTYEGLAFTERLALLVEQEVLSRDQRKQERLIRQARFKLAASVPDIDYQHPRNLKPAQMARLAQGDWINRGQNLLITGPCGSGKQQPRSGGRVNNVFADCESEYDRGAP